MVEAPAPFSLQRLDHLVLRTENIASLQAFYMALGCTLERDALDTIGLLQLRLGASMLDLVDVNGQLGQSGGAAPEATGRNLDHFAIRIDPFDADAILAFCQSRGIPAHAMHQPLLGADGYGPAVYIEDPDGNRVELKGPPEDIPADNQFLKTTE